MAPLPDPSHGVLPATSRSEAGRGNDHVAIERLAEELLPALIAKLAATDLGELEVREGPWRIRLRRPADGSQRTRRPSQRPSRNQPGHADHGHAPGALEGHRPVRGPGMAAGSTNGSAGSAGEDGPRVARRMVATSPAVGFYQPGPEVRVGARVRAGDRIGSVDMLGVPQEVVAPVDGVIGASLVDPGQPVEYGQELVVIELAGGAARAGEPGTEATA